MPLLLAVFAILFGTRQHRRDRAPPRHDAGDRVESLVKLRRFVAIGGYALCTAGPGKHARSGPGATGRARVVAGLPGADLLAFCAMFCLPRQFQVGMVECEDPATSRGALDVSVVSDRRSACAVLPIVAAGAAMPQVRDGVADAWVLALPMAHGDRAVALLAFIGGFRRRPAW